MELCKKMGQLLQEVLGLAVACWSVVGFSSCLIIALYSFGCGSGSESSKYVLWECSVGTGLERVCMKEDDDKDNVIGAAVKKCVHDFASLGYPAECPSDVCWDTKNVCDPNNPPA